MLCSGGRYARCACFQLIIYYFFLNVEHSVSDASEQHERMPAWLATLIDSAVQ